MIYLLTIIFGLLQLFDWYSTVTIINRGGYEQNPVMAFVFKYVKPKIAMGIKGILVTWLGYLLATIPIVVKIKEISIDFLIQYTLELNIDFTIPSPYLLIPLIAIYSWVAYHNGKSLWQ